MSDAFIRTRSVIHPGDGMLRITSASSTVAVRVNLIRRISSPALHSLGLDLSDFGIGFLFTV